MFGNSSMLRTRVIEENGAIFDCAVFAAILAVMMMMMMIVITNSSPPACLSCDLYLLIVFPYRHHIVGINNNVSVDLSFYL